MIKLSWSLGGSAIEPAIKRIIGLGRRLSIILWRIYPTSGYIGSIDLWGYIVASHCQPPGKQSKYLFQ